MKKHITYSLLATSLVLWNCKTDKVLIDKDPAQNQSGARVSTQAAPVKQWDLTRGGTGNDLLAKAVTYTNGKVILGGFSDSPAGGDKFNAYGGNDYYIVNVNPDGTQLGAQSVGSSGDDVLTSVVATADKGLLLGGWSNSPASTLGTYKSSNSKGGYDYWVVKLAANGQKQWDRTLGGSGQDQLTAMLPTADGGYLLGGSSDSPAGSDKSQSSQGVTDYWVIKLDASGNKQWDKTFGGINYDYLNSMVATPDGGFLLGGQSFGTNTYWIVKIDANGTKLWDRTLGSLPKTIATTCSLVTTTDGGFLLGGSSKSLVPGPYAGLEIVNYNYWVAKLDANGYKQWDRSFGGAMNSDPGTDQLGSLLATADGGYLLGGTSNSGATGDKTEGGRGVNDYWVVKIDASGNKQWDKTLGGPGEDYFKSMTATTDGGYVIGGLSYSGAGSDKTGASKGGYDYWAVKIK